MMSEINQKEYLKKYLSGSEVGKKKKHKKKAASVGSRVKIIDDDECMHTFNEAVQEDLLATNEDAPQIVGIIDERPIELRLDEFKTKDSWKTFIVEDKKSSENDRKSNVSSQRRNDFGENVNTSRRFGNEDNSPPRRRRLNDDMSPNRRNNSDAGTVWSRNLSKKEDSSPPRKRSDDDNSPPRRQGAHRADNSPSKRNKLGRAHSKERSNDSSPPRRSNWKDETRPTKNMERRDSRKEYDDTSPPRRRTKYEDMCPPRKARKDNHMIRANHSPHRRMDGKKAGLQKSKDVVNELRELKQREDDMFRNMNAEISGANAATVLRDRKTGKIRNLEEEVAEQETKNKCQAEVKEKYDKWGKGTKQVEEYESKLAQDAYEMSKPLARYADDNDLERFLKEQDREGDPMLNYIRKKRKKEAVVTSSKPLKPQYEGEFMPNRFGVRPGHRWDGVDRSNGYETKWFEVQNAKTAQREEAYKWNTEDM